MLASYTVESVISTIERLSSFRDKNVYIGWCIGVLYSECLHCACACGLTPILGAVCANSKSAYDTVSVDFLLARG